MTASLYRHTAPPPAQTTDATRFSTPRLTEPAMRARSATARRPMPAEQPLEVPSPMTAHPSLCEIIAPIVQSIPAERLRIATQVGHVPSLTILDRSRRALPPDATADILGAVHDWTERFAAAEGVAIQRASWVVKTDRSDRAAPRGRVPDVPLGSFLRAVAAVTFSDADVAEPLKIAPLIARFAPTRTRSPLHVEGMSYGLHNTGPRTAKGLQPVKAAIRAWSLAHTETLEGLRGLALTVTIDPLTGHDRALAARIVRGWDTPPLRLAPP